jgi:Lrp/AsnC family transcriptional regulator for asnA, asnC and gidA
MNIDALDEKLLKVLKDNARQSAEKVAKRLKVSPTTVRRRMKKLTRSGAVVITAMVDPSKIGITVQLGDIESAADFLVKQNEVKWVSTTTGRFDLLFLAGFHSTTELADFIQRKMASIKGLKDIEVFVCLDMKKGGYVPY